MKYVTGTRTIDPQTTVVACQGEMDTLAVEELRQAIDPLLADSTMHLILDLAKVDYVSSSVLAFLLAAQGKARAKEGKVSLVGANELVKQSFVMAALDTLFAFHGTLDDLGITLSTPAPTKGREKVPKKEKKASLRETKTGVSKVEGPTLHMVGEPQAPSREVRTPEKDQAMSSGQQSEREAREVERIQPLPEVGSWKKDYGVWLGIAAAVAVSITVSVYLYLTQV